MKCIFSTTPVGNLEKSWRTLAQRHRTQCLCVRCALCFKVVRVRHRMLSTRRRPIPVGASGAAWLLRESLTESTGLSGCVQWCASGVRAFCSALWVRDRTLRSASSVWVRWPRAFADLSAHETGVYRMRPVPTWPRPVLCRWPLEIDARKWKGQHVVVFRAPDAGLERLVVPYGASGDP